MLVKGHVIPEHHFGAWVDDIGNPDRGTKTQALFHSLKNCISGVGHKHLFSKCKYL